MAYIGHSASGNFTTKPSKDTFSGDGSTTAFTLSEGATTNTVDVFVENVRQEPTTAYTVDGTTLTFTAAPGSGTNNIYVVNRGPLQLSATHPAAQALAASTGTFTGALSGVAATFTGDLTVDTNTLVVDSTNNRVGVGTASPSQPLHFKGGAVQFENTQNSYLQINTTDTHLYTAGAHPLRLGTNSTERLRIDSSGNVGIGTSSPTQALELNFTGYGGMVVNSTDNAGMAAIRFDSTSGAQFNQVQSGHMEFRTADTERMRILAGGGLTFNGDTAADNALDDYEQGTFTPVFDQSGTAITGVTTDINTGKYTKIGNKVTVQIYLHTTAAGSPTSSALTVGNLPFNAANVNNVLPSVSIGYVANFVTANPTTGFLQLNTDYIRLFTTASADARTNSATMAGTYLGSDTYLILNATYLTD